MGPARYAYYLVFCISFRWKVLQQCLVDFFSWRYVQGPKPPDAKIFTDREIPGECGP